MADKKKKGSAVSYPNRYTTYTIQRLNPKAYALLEQLKGGE